MRQVGASWLACLLQQLSRQHNTDVFDTLKRSLLQNLFILQLISECFKLNCYIQRLYSSELYIKYKELRDDSGQGSNQPLRGNHDVRHIASDFSTCNRNTLILLSAPEKSSIWLFGLQPMIEIKNECHASGVDVCVFARANNYTLKPT